MTVYGPREATRAGSPDVVRVRLSGHPDGTAALARVLAALPGVEILAGPDGPYPNRRQPGSRSYLTVRLTSPPATGPGTVTSPMEGHPPMITEPAAPAPAGPVPEAGP